MAEKKFTGVISFVHHQKHYATIEYRDGEKKKSINFQTGTTHADIPAISPKSKKHYFRTGDTVQFELALTPKGDRLNAYQVDFLYNNELDKLLNKAKTNNLFKGFLKVSDDAWFVKELQSYLFFPLVFSSWELRPPENRLNEAFDFRLINMDKQQVSAELARPVFIPAYKTATRLFHDKSIIPANVLKVSAYGVYVEVAGKDILGKLPPAKEGAALKPGDKVNIRITYLSPQKIVVVKA
jgi:hypothetical protein